MRSTVLADDEEMVGVFRQHWFVLVRPVLVALVVLLALVVVFAVEEFRGARGYSLLAVVASVLFCVYRFFAWRNNLWIVTSKRVVDERGVLSIDSKESPIDKINNVSVRRTLFGRVFGYGNIQIQTAAEMGATEEVFIRDAGKLRSCITGAQEGYRKAQIAEQAKALSGSGATGSVGDGRTIECPYCAETIKAKAKICRYCEKELVGASGA